MGSHRGIFKVGEYHDHIIIFTLEKNHLEFFKAKARCIRLLESIGVDQAGDSGFN